MAGQGLTAEGHAARHLVIRGRVQGVGYRDWVVAEAGRRGVTGWVRNRTDGTVEAVLAGPAEAVAALAEACRSGPRGARVTGIAETGWRGNLPAGFNRRATA